MDDAAGAYRYGVVVRLSDALQAGALVDYKGSAILGGELEERRIENVDAAAKADEVHWSRHTAVNLKIRRANNFQSAVGSRERDKSQRARSYCGKALTMRRHCGLELKHLAAREGHRNQVRPGGFETVVRDELLRNCFVPLEAQPARLLESNVVETQRPAEAEIANTLIAAVVGARDIHRHTRHGDVQVSERDREVSDFEVSLDDDRDRGARDLSVAVGSRQPEIEQTIQHHSWVERAEFGV